MVRSFVLTVPVFLDVNLNFGTRLSRLFSIGRWVVGIKKIRLELLLDTKQRLHYEKKTYFGYGMSITAGIC